MKLKYRFLLPAIILLIPLIAMQFTDEVNWNFFDFLIAFVLLLSVFFGLNFIAAKVKPLLFRIIFMALALILFFLVWAELAVGIL